MENLNPLGIQSVQQFSTMYSVFIYTTSPKKKHKNRRQLQTKR